MPTIPITLTLNPAEVRADAERFTDAGHHGTAHLLYKALEALEDGTPEVRAALGMVYKGLEAEDAEADEADEFRYAHPVIREWLAGADVDTDHLLDDLRDALDRVRAAKALADAQGRTAHTRAVIAAHAHDTAVHAVRAASAAIPPVGRLGRPDPLPGLPEAADLLDALHDLGWHLTRSVPEPRTLTLDEYVLDKIVTHVTERLAAAADTGMAEPQEHGAAVVATTSGSVHPPLVRYRDPDGKWRARLDGDHLGVAMPWSSLVDPRPALFHEAQTGKVDQ